MNIDAELLFSENQSIAAASSYSKVINVGPSLKYYHTLFCSVNLTAPFTAGRITSIKVQTAADEAFSTPVDLIEIVLLNGIDQTRAANLTQFRMPLTTKEYVRLVYTATSPAGGKVFASLVKEVPLR